MQHFVCVFSKGWGRQKITAVVTVVAHRTVGSFDNTMLRIGSMNMLLHGVEDASFVRHDNTLARPLIDYTAADRVNVVLSGKFLPYKQY